MCRLSCEPTAEISPRTGFVSIEVPTQMVSVPLADFLGELVLRIEQDIERDGGDDLAVSEALTLALVQSPPIRLDQAVQSAGLGAVDVEDVSVRIALQHRPVADIVLGD